MGYASLQEDIEKRRDDFGARVAESSLAISLRRRTLDERDLRQDDLEFIEFLVDTESRVIAALDYLQAVDSRMKSYRESLCLAGVLVVAHRDALRRSSRVARRVRHGLPGSDPCPLTRLQEARRALAHARGVYHVAILNDLAGFRRRLDDMALSCARAGGFLDRVVQFLDPGHYGGTKSLTPNERRRVREIRSCAFRRSRYAGEVSTELKSLATGVSKLSDAARRALLQCRDEINALAGRISLLANRDVGRVSRSTGSAVRGAAAWRRL